MIIGLSNPLHKRLSGFQIPRSGGRASDLFGVRKGIYPLSHCLGQPRCGCLMHLIESNPHSHTDQ